MFGALLAPAALGTLVSTFRDPRQRGKAFGVFGSAAAGGGAIGLVLGGALTQYLSWRWTLYVNLVFAAVAVAGALAYIRSSRPVTRPRMDWPGAVLACAGLFGIVFGIVGLPRVGPRALIATGMVLGACGTGYLTQVSVTSSYASAVLPALLIMGLGFGMIFAPAINTAMAGVAPEDSGVASALVNTMQQVGGSIGTSALSTIALSATTSYLVAHHAGVLAPAIAATHGYTVAFAVSSAPSPRGRQRCTSYERFPSPCPAVHRSPNRRSRGSSRHASAHSAGPLTRRPGPVPCAVTPN